MIPIIHTDEPATDHTRSKHGSDVAVTDGDISIHNPVLDTVMVQIMSQNPVQTRQAKSPLLIEDQRGAQKFQSRFKYIIC